MSTCRENLLIVDRWFFTFGVSTESQLMTPPGTEGRGRLAAQFPALLLN